MTTKFMLNNILYYFKCTFSKPLNGCKGISIGLLDCMTNEKTKYNYFDSFPGNGANIIFKGGYLNKTPLNMQVKVINFKVNIEK